MHASWTSVPIARIEDLRDAVYGAGLEATQVSTGSLSGNLTFARRDDVLYSSGLINGQVALRGPLSSDRITVGVGLRMGGGTRHWLEEPPPGAVGVFDAGDEHDALYTRGSLYATATLSLEQLEQLAAREELVLDRPVLGAPGFTTAARGLDAHANLPRLRADPRRQSRPDARDWSRPGTAARLDQPPRACPEEWRSGGPHRCTCHDRAGGHAPTLRSIWPSR